MKTHDKVEKMMHMNGDFYARVRVYTNGDTTAVIASPVFGGPGHLINRRASWLATHAASIMGLPVNARFFSTYIVDGGDELHRVYYELCFRWIGKVAIETTNIKQVAADVVSAAIGEDVICISEVLPKETA